MDVGFRSVDELAEGKVFGLNLIDAQILHQVDVADDAGLDELGGVDVKGEDPLEVTRENQRTNVAMGVGVEFPKTLKAWQRNAQRFESAFRHKAAEESPGKTVFLESWHQPAHEVVIVAFRNDAEQAVVGADEAVMSDPATA